MAKRQNFIVGSTNGNTETQTVEQLNRAWDQYAVLHSSTLDGVFNAVSDYSNDSSNEIANAIQSITGAQPTGANQNELAGALSLLRADIESTSMTFKGYVATSAPSSSTYSLKIGNLWINSSAMPTSFPVAASSIKVWDGSSWVNYGSTYTPANFDFFKDINNKAGYYWLGGAWAMFSTDFSTDYFTLNANTGKWQISTSYNNSLAHIAGAETFTGRKTFNAGLEIASAQNIKFSTGVTDYFTIRTTGSPSQGLGILLNNEVSKAYIGLQTNSISIGGTGITTTLGGTVNATTQGSSDDSVKVATTAFVHSITDLLAPKASPALTGNPTAPTQATSNNSTRIATTAFVKNQGYALDTEVVKLSGAQTIADVKTFNSSPVVPTPVSSDNSTKVASTAFVNNFLRRSFSKNVPTFSQLSAQTEYTSGDIVLTESFLNYDYIAVFIGSDRNEGNNLFVRPSWELHWLLNSTATTRNLLLASNNCGQYWCIKPYVDGSTETILKYSDENAIIHIIYGFNL